LVTDDVVAARKFYSAMFNWGFLNAGDYLIATHDDRPLCGMFQRPRPANQPEAKPRWIGYLSVASVKRAASAVTKAGGKVLAEPRKLPKRGEQALFADAEGAVFGVVKSSSGDPPDFQAEPGDWIWVQLLSRDGHKAAAFYRDLAGYEIVENAQANRLSDYVLTSGRYARATVRTIPPEHPQVQPNWLLFVRVKDLGASLTQCRQLGGQVLLEPRPDLLAGKVAVIADPTGAAIGILEWSDQLLKGKP
jgi:predicted enzyme related to lactoylglutathione lyase